MAARLPIRDLLARLVAIDTTSRASNRPLADLVCDYLDRPGVRVERLVTREGEEGPEKVNLQIELGPPTDPDERLGLVLCGHMDTVPAEEEGWSADPFQLVERDGGWYGRGACDMKAFLALAIDLAAATDPSALRQPLVLLFTHDEETGALGAQRVAATAGERDPLPRATVIGEPTGLKVVRMHKGSVRFRLTVHGESAHGGYPHLGRNAVVSAAAGVAALDALAREWTRQRPPTAVYFDGVPYVALNVGTIRGGSAVNVVPDRCHVEFGVRPLPGTETQELRRQIRAALDAALPEGGYGLEVLNEIPPLLLDEEAPIYRRLCRLVGQLQSFGVSFASDAGPLQRLGLDCALYGPGSISTAHRPDEVVPVAEVETARRTLTRLVLDCCGGSGG